MKALTISLLFFIVTFTLLSLVYTQNSACPNNCNVPNGFCVPGIGRCQCYGAWTGIDCSISMLF